MVDTSNHGKVGEALYLKFSAENFKKLVNASTTKAAIEIGDGKIYTIEDLDKQFGTISSVPVHIDDMTQGDYECVCENGTEIHEFGE